jgi:hypothetical protein
MLPFLMLALSLEGSRPRLTHPRPRSLYANRCHPACPERTRRERSQGSWLVRPSAPTASFEQSPLCRHPSFLAVNCKLSTACPERSRRVNCHPLSPFPVYPACPEERRELRRATLLPRAVATGTSYPQQPENKTTLRPQVAFLDAASRLTPLFATLTKNTRGWGTSASFLCVNSAHSPSQRYLFLSSTAVSCNMSAVSSPPVTPNYFRFRTYKKTGEGVSVGTAIPSRPYAVPRGRTPNPWNKSPIRASSPVRTTSRHNWRRTTPASPASTRSCPVAETY